MKAKNGMKRCSRGDKCVHPDGPVLPVSEFNRDKSTSDGFSSPCKACEAVRRHRRYQENAEVYRQRKRGYNLKHKDEINKRLRLKRQANPEKHREANRRNWLKNGEKYRITQQQKRADNPEKYRARDRRYYQENVEKFREYKQRYWAERLQRDPDYNRRRYQKRNAAEDRERSRLYRKKHREELNERQRLYYRQDKERTFVHNRVYRARKRRLPAFYPRDTFKYALELTYHTCLYCGGQLQDLFGTVKPHRDHWIPLAMQCDDHPGHTPWNVMPSCSTCNLSKKAKEPRRWLIERFGEKQARVILRRVEAFIEAMHQRYDAAFEAWRKAQDSG